MNNQLYTQEQMDIALLKNSNEGILRTLIEIKDEIRDIRGDIKSQFHWTLGLIFGSYALVIPGLVGAISKATGWF
jgi:hypothetical protein